MTQVIFQNFFRCALQRHFGYTSRLGMHPGTKGIDAMNRAEVIQNVSPESSRRDQPLIVVATRQRDHGHENLDNDTVDALLDQAERRGWRLLDLNLTSGSLSGGQKPAGALVTLLPTDELAGYLRSFDIPVVRLGRLAHPDDAIMPVVYPDHAQAGGIAAEVFAERGFTDVATVGHQGSTMADLVEEGFRARATAMGCQYHRHVFVNLGSDGSSQEKRDERYDRRSRALAEWLGELPKPVGLLASNSSIAGMVSIMCAGAKLAVPEDVALLSVGDHRSHCQLGPVSISAVDQHPEDMVRVAMNLLDEMMKGRSVPSRTLVPPRGVVARRSTDILAVDDPIVARAIRYIWDHLDLPLSVSDVASAMNTPRYKLERLFSKYYKRGVHGEVRRARLERFRELLRTTDQTVDELAPQVGYKSAKRLHVAFRDTFGQTPRRYRLQARQAEDEVVA